MYYDAACVACSRLYPMRHKSKAPRKVNDVLSGGARPFLPVREAISDGLGEPENVVNHRRVVNYYTAPPAYTSLPSWQPRPHGALPAQRCDTPPQDVPSTDGVPYSLLQHSGHWVPRKYYLSQVVPGTGYWTCCNSKGQFSTHCVSLDARVRQRIADHQREIARRQSTTRAKIASEFRATWGARNLTDQSDSVQAQVDDDEGLGNPPAQAGTKLRPFQRKKWPSRCLGEELETRLEHEPIRGDQSTGRGQSRDADSKLVVREEHVCSIVDLIASEASSNVHVATSALRGLKLFLERPSRVHSLMANSESNAVWANGSCPRSRENREDTGGVDEDRLVQSEGAQTMTASSAEVDWRMEALANTRQPSFARGAIDGISAGSGGGGDRIAALGQFRDLYDGTSAPAFCLSLGALSAVVCCLGQHEGHAGIESLAITLLKAFAEDEAASRAVCGNTSVARICMERMLRTPQTAAATPGIAAGKQGAQSKESAVRYAGSSDPVHSIILPNAPAVQRQTAVPISDVMFILSVNLRHSSECQTLLLRACGIEAALRALRGPGMDDPMLAANCFGVLEHLCGEDEAQRRVIDQGSVEEALGAIARFRWDARLLAAAMGLLVTLSKVATCRHRILKYGGVRLICHTMKRLVGEHEVQLKGAEMLQALINSDAQARIELDGIKGGWECLCQGTPLGNALQKYAPGERRVTGWTVSEEEHVTTEDALEAAGLAAPLWTMHSLAKFMQAARKLHGRAPKMTKPDYCEYFGVVNEAGLLPRAREDLDEWRERLRRYERAHHVRLNDIARRRVGRGAARDLPQGLSQYQLG